MTLDKSFLLPSQFSHYIAGSIVGELAFRQRVDPVVEVTAEAADDVTIGVNRLGLQALELQVFEMAGVLPGKGRHKILRHAGLSSRSIAKSPPVL
jgi:hypothetical protein